jgi:polyhydroxyalkanoate synthesis regulator phasin
MTTSIKSSLIEQLRNGPSSVARESYTTHTESEKRCARQISDFVKNNPELKERAVFIQPPNEYGVNKMACTSIRPTLLPKTELYDLRQCSEFVARFVQYEPRESSDTEQVVISPTQTLSWAVGDAFDMSVLLVSLLIGAGYDAYVVIGHAPAYIRLKDQTHMKCTLEKRERTDPLKPWSVDAIVQDACPLDKVKDRIDLHCWVLVKSSCKRDLTEGSCFVEPSTGIIYPLDQDVPYNSMWCAFNDKNYWVNASNSDVCLTDDISPWLKVLPNIAPFSHVSKIEILSEQYALRYPPSGKRCLLLDKAKIEYFGDSIDPQGLATRISQFEDDDQTVVVQITELFSPNTRDDHLIQRIRRPLDMSFVETYSMKNPHSVVKRSETASRRTIKFHPKSRSDGLIERVEDIGTFITETFHDRSDSLIQRVVELKRLPRDAKKPKGDVIVCGSGLGLAAITRVDDHYAAPKDKSALNTSVASRSYQLKEKQVVVTHHCHHEALQTSDTYSKDDMFEPNATGRSLLKLEHTTIQALKKTQDEMIELREAIYHRDLKMLSNIDPPKSDDAATGTAGSASKDDAQDESKTFDYLEPFLEQIDNKGPLTQDEASQVKDACLKNFKDRLLERANIMQSRLDTARQELGRKQEASAVAEDTFRIKVMEKRLREHEDAAITRYKVRSFISYLYILKSCCQLSYCIYFIIAGPREKVERG